MSLPSIFTITVLTEPPPGGRYERRVWGWFPTQPEAVRAVLENDSDLFEHGCYRYAVVEEVPPGLSSEPVSARWFRATYYDAGAPTVLELPGPPRDCRDYCYAMG